MRHLILRPGEIGIVRIGREPESLREVPGEPEIDAALVLDSSSITVTLGIEGTIGIRIKTLQDHQTKSVRHTKTGCIDGGQVALTVCGRLSAEGHSRRGIAVVET